ncbi:MAG: hypothetical protein H6867_06475 [Rhodospirillales bacterium]|nr:hypothetical protein [Rhodospirillales bacterium]MCB9995194.1 hypothetical protein [Rhodospirillales bacterium]
MLCPAPIKTVFLTFTALFFLLNTPANAAINAQDAEKLKGIFQELLTEYSTVAKDSEAELIAEGEILVEPNDFYYAATLPHLTLKYDDGSKLEVGMLALNVMPGDTPEQWKMTLAIPTPLVFYDGNGARAITTNIGSQNFAGVWHEPLKNFLKINAQYKDVEINGNLDNFKLSAPNVVITSSLDQSKDGLWSGPANMMVSDLKIDAGNGGYAAVKDIALTSAITDYSLDAAINYQEQINALSESYDSGDNPSGSSSHILGIYNMIFGFLGEGLDGFSVGVTMKGFEIGKPENSATPAETVKIGNTGLAFGMEGFRSGSVNMSLKTGYHDFALTPLNEDYSKATPNNVDIDLSVNNLPYKEIVNLGRNSISMATQGSPEAGKLAGLQAIMTLPQLLTQAQTSLALKNTAFGNTHYNVKINGDMTANLKAVTGATGKARTEVAGLENLIQALQQSSTNPDLDATKKQSLQKTLSMLAVLQMAGQMDKDDKGQDIRVYNLELNEQGQALLNGTDLQMVMQAGK